MFDVVVQIRDRTVRRVFNSNKQGVLCACRIIERDCSDFAVDCQPDQRDKLIDKLLDEEHTDSWGSPNNWDELEAPGEMPPNVRIMLSGEKIKVVLDSDVREYPYSRIGTYSHGSGRTFVDEGVWGRIAYNLLRTFYVQEG